MSKGTSYKTRGQASRCGTAPTDPAAGRVVSLILVLAIGVLASATRALAHEPVAAPAAASVFDHFPRRLLPLIADLEAQLQLAYGSSRPLLDARLQYTLDVVAAWQQSGCTPADEVLLEDWIRDAVRRSVAGRRLPLPPAPGFSPREVSHSAGRDGDLGAPRVQPAAPGVAAVHPRRAIPAAPPLPLTLATGSETTESAPQPAPRRVVAPPRTAVRTPAVEAVVPPRRVAQVATDDAPAPLVQLASAGESSDAAGATGGVSMPNEMETDEHIVPVDHRVNLREYVARLVGHRVAVRRLESQLAELREPTAEQLAQLVGQLESVANQAAFLMLYADLLADEERDVYGTPISARSATETLRRLVTSHIASRGAATDPPRPAAEPEQLRRLANLVETIDASLAALDTSP